MRSPVQIRAPRFISNPSSHESGDHPRDAPALRVRPVGWVRSPLVERESAPKQGDEGSPESVIELDPAYAEAARDLRAGDDAIVLTWLCLLYTSDAADE